MSRVFGMIYVYPCGDIRADTNDIIVDVTRYSVQRIRSLSKDHCIASVAVHCHCNDYDGQERNYSGAYWVLEHP